MQSMQSLNVLIKEFEDYSITNNYIRLGQYFINTYVSRDNSFNWSRLFYEKNFLIASKIIMGWLIDNSYTDVLPPKQEH